MIHINIKPDYEIFVSNKYNPESFKQWLKAREDNNIIYLEYDEHIKDEVTGVLFGLMVRDRSLLTYNDIHNLVTEFITDNYKSFG